MHDIKPITAHTLASVLDDLEAENCRRLAAGRPPIVPVSIHYFLRDGRMPRAIPEAVRAPDRRLRGRAAGPLREADAAARRTGSRRRRSPRPPRSRRADRAAGAIAPAAEPWRSRTFARRSPLGGRI